MKKQTQININMAILAGLVAVAAVVFATFDRPTSRGWMDTVFGLVTVLNFGAFVVAISLAGRVRSIALAYAVCSAGYLILTYKAAHPLYGISAGLAGALLSWALTQPTGDPDWSNSNMTDGS